MGMLSDFKSFAMRGNVIDMAVGIVIGAAFGKIVSSFVSDIIMPPIGVLLGGVNFTELTYIVKHATETSPAVTINYGTFIQTLIDFVIIAFAIFMVVRMMVKLHRQKAEEAPAEAPVNEDTVLLKEIRDLLKNNRK